MPALLFPLGLAALLSVVVPLVIHLMRRDELRPVMFAALRWLDPKPKPRQRIQFSEWPLLLTRLLLIAVLALLLARPVLTVPMGDKPYVAVVPGADVAALRQVAGEDAEVHWLAEGFPAFDDKDAPAADAVISRLRQLDAQLPAGVKLTVVVPETLYGADAERPILSRPVDWRIVGGTMPAAQVLATKAPVLSVRYAPDQAAGVRYLRAAAAAWGTPFEAAGTETALPARDRVLVWLGTGALPQAVRDWANSGGTVLSGSAVTLPESATRMAVWRDEAGVVLAEAQAEGKGRLLRLTRPLTPAAMPVLYESNFPEKLKYVISPDAVAPSRVASRDLIPVAGRAAFARALTDLAPFLALLAAALFLIERVLATRARRRAAP